LIYISILIVDESPGQNVYEKKLLHQLNTIHIQPIAPSFVICGGRNFFFQIKSRQFAGREWNS